MNNEKDFIIVGRNFQPPEKKIKPKKRYFKGKPMISIIILIGLIAGCMIIPWIGTHNPGYMNLTNYNQPPNSQFIFGTDMMGRDIFAMIWSGGRISLFIGLFATFLSTVIAIIYGTISGLAPVLVDEVMMRITEIILSIPGLLIIIFIQAIFGQNNVIVIAIVIGITSWMSIAKMVRTQVRQIRDSEYVLASKCMGGGFGHVLVKHLAPNFISSIMFMVVMNIRGAIVAESTLSFLGIGLPIEIISWGSMLSLAEKALMTNSWWMIVIPGLFLVGTLMCITNIGNYIRKGIAKKESNL